MPSTLMIGPPLGVAAIRLWLGRMRTAKNRVEFSTCTVTRSLAAKLVQAVVNSKGGCRGDVVVGFGFCVTITGEGPDLPSCQIDTVNCRDGGAIHGGSAGKTSNEGCGICACAGCPAVSC